MNITQRLILSYSLLITSLISLVIAAVLIMSGFQGRFQYVQEHAIPSIIDLGDMIDKSDSLIIWLYRHQSSTNKEKQMQIEKQINQTIENLRQSNLRYLKNSISNDRDRQLTENALNIIDTLRGKLPIFITGSIAQDDAITLRELQGNKGIGQAARDLIANYRVQLKHNMEYGENLERYNKRIYHLTFWSMIIAASAIVLILSVLTLRTILGIRNSLNAIRDTMARSSAALDLTRRVDDARMMKSA